MTATLQQTTANANKWHGNGGALGFRAWLMEWHGYNGPPTTGIIMYYTHHRAHQHCRPFRRQPAATARKMRSVRAYCGLMSEHFRYRQSESRGQTPSIIRDETDEHNCARIFMCHAHTHTEWRFCALAFVLLPGPCCATYFCGVLRVLVHVRRQHVT